MSGAETMSTKVKLQVDVVSDVMCPWCFIGKRNLEAAAGQIDDIELDVRWRPYQLDPTLPAEGKDRRQYLSDKFGGDERAGEIYGRIRQAGSTVGIDFNFDAIEVSPNTLDAHRLIHWAGGQGADIQDRLVTRLFELYFLEGGNVGDHQVLVKAAGDAGMDAEIVRDLLASDRDREAIERQISTARAMGVTGVPCFILDNKAAIVGAQPPQALVQAFRQIAGDKAEEAQYRT